MHKLSQPGHMVNRRFGQNAMPEVEHMTIPISIARQYPGGLPMDDVRRSQQDRRIEVTLQRDTIAHASACLAYVNGPI